MKIKELQKTVNVAWSPVQQYPCMLATGTAAQQLDSSSASNATLELYAINLAEPGYDLMLKGSQASAHRFHKLIWSPFGFGASHPNGLVTGGCENGVIQVYSPAKILSSEEGLLSQQNKHSGAVRTLDYNPFQTNLLASGASESEIFIWDLNNTTTPMNPGAKTQPFEDVQEVAWNRQVQHIMASVFPARCVIWDLRKNEPIIKLTDTQSRIRWKTMQWHPDIATQLWLGSEDDQCPTIQLWDLRFATAPTKAFNIHQRGVLGITWCEQDRNLMASCGKDNKIYIWDQSSELPEGEVLSELTTTNQWNFDVTWCPRNPAMIAGSSFDGNVSIYSVFGGVQQQVQTFNKIASSFPGMEPIDEPTAHQQTIHTVFHDMKKPAKWMKRPVGAKFGFGGRLFSFNATSKSVTVNQVITDQDLVDRSNQLEQVLSQGHFADYCRQKADQSLDQHSRFLWYFLKANFEENPQKEMLNLLGYHPDDMASKFKKFVEPVKEESEKVEDLTNQMANLSQTTDTNDDVFDAIAAGSKISEEKQQAKEEADKKSEIPYKIKIGEDQEGLICEALLTGNLEAAVEICMDSGRTTEGLILAMNGGSELLAKTQYRYLKNNDSYLSNVISALVTADWSGVVTQCTIDSWKEALVAALTHCHAQLPLLCERLGERLQIESNGDFELAKNAILCYICAGNTERLVEAWNLSKPNLPMGGLVNGEADSNNNSNKDLQELVEVVMLLQKALEIQGRSSDVTGKLAELLSQYAKLLAAQGSLESALTYLGTSTDTELEELRERLYYALGHKQFEYHSALQDAFAAPQPVKPVQPPAAVNPLFPTVGEARKNSQPFNYMQPTPVMPPQPMQPVSTPWNPYQPNPMQQSQPTFAEPPMAAKPPVGPPPPTGDLTQPPRPPSTPSSTPRPKYVVDPSVKSGPNYGQVPPANFNYNPNPMNPSYGQNTLMNPMAQPQQPPQLYQAQPQQQQQQFKPFMPVPLATTNYLPGVPPVEIGQPAIPMQPQQRNPTPPPGWNDPPALRSSRPAPKPQEFQPVSPITQPLLGGAAPQNGYPDPNAGYGYDQQMAPPPTMMNPAAPIPVPLQPTGQMYPGMPQASDQVRVNYTTFHNQSTPMHQQQQPKPPTPQPEPPKQKPPLPEEYVYLQTVFEELKRQCISAAGNPQTKRKLEDVSKRLECLYDLLREHRLSQNMLTSLNQLVQLIQIGDYTNAISLHTHMVSGPDFSQIASFMPGIKVLLQSAMQLQVYLR